MRRVVRVGLSSAIVVLLMGLASTAVPRVSGACEYECIGLRPQLAGGTVREADVPSNVGAEWGDGVLEVDYDTGLVSAVVLADGAHLNVVDQVARRGGIAASLVAGCASPCPPRGECENPAEVRLGEYSAQAPYYWPDEAGPADGLLRVGEETVEFRYEDSAGTKWIASWTVTD